MIRWEELRRIELSFVWPYATFHWEDEYGAYERMFPRIDPGLYDVEGDRLGQVGDELAELFTAVEERTGQRVDGGWLDRDDVPWEVAPRWPRGGVLGGYRSAARAEPVRVAREPMMWERALMPLARAARRLVGEGPCFWLSPVRIAVTDDQLYGLHANGCIYRAPLARLAEGDPVAELYGSTGNPRGFLFGRRTWLELRFQQDDDIFFHLATVLARVDAAE